MNKRNKKIIIIIIVATFIVLGGMTYAYFSAGGITGNTNTNTIVTLTADYGNIIVTYDNSKGIISASNINLAESEKGQDNLYLMKFNIESTATIFQDISIRWKEIANNFCQYASGQACTDVETDSFVGNELSYNLYSCSETNYNNVTTANVSANCTSIGTNSVPVTSSTSDVTTAKYIRLNPQSKTYYVLIIVLKNITTEQNYNQGKSFTGQLDVQRYTNTDLLASNIVTVANLKPADETSTYVSSPTGINFSQNNSLTNGQGLYSVGNVKFYRGDTFCAYPNYASEGPNGSYCIAAGGTWVGVGSYYCSLDDSQSACEAGGGTFYDLHNTVKFGVYGADMYVGEFDFYGSVSYKQFSSLAACTSDEYYNDDCHKIIDAGDPIYWKIIRINSNGTIRMIYNGNSATARQHFAQVARVTYNDPGLFGELQSQESALEYAAYTNSNVFSAINTWYVNNLSSYSNYLSDENFCNDISWGYVDELNDYHYFSTYTRLWTDHNPTYSCSGASALTVANGKLNYPIATISADEAYFAGGATNEYGANLTFFLQNGGDYWTMSPDYWIPAGNLFVRYVNIPGGISTNYYYASGGVRPVISLKSNVVISSGSGSITDPWIIE